MVYPEIRLVFCFFLSLAIHGWLFSGMFVGLPYADSGKASVLQARLSSRHVSDRALPAESPVIQPIAQSAPASSSSAPAPVPETTAVAGPAGSDRSLLSQFINNYLLVSQLTKPPSPIDSIDPTPPGFEKTGLVGDIEFMLLISAEGEIDAVLLISSSLPEPVVAYARSAFEKARFSPGEVNNVSVRSRLRVVLSPNSRSIDPETGNPLSVKNRRR